MNVVFSVHNLGRNTLGREKGFLRKKVLVLDFKTGNAISLERNIVIICYYCMVTCLTMVTYFTLLCELLLW